MRMTASEVGNWLRQIVGKRDHREVLSADNDLVLRPGLNFDWLMGNPAVRSGMVVPSSRTREGWVELKAVKLAGPELLEAGKRVGCVGEQIEPGAFIPRDGDRAIVDAIIEPMAL